MTTKLPEGFESWDAYYAALDADAVGRAESAESAERSGCGGFPRIPRLPRRQTWTPPELEQAALHGLAGYWAEALQPHTEASVAGTLLVTLTGFGNAVGRTPHMQVGGTRHHANEFVLLVGPTATGRKGETTRIGLRPLERADADWKRRIHRGFGSGEAVIDDVRDPIPAVDGDERHADAGADDKRLLVADDEFASVLAIAGRDGSTLSMLLRNAWDGRPLENRTRARKAIATDAHVSVVSAITPEELLRRASVTEIANGFLNRFLLVAVYRSKRLPEPPPIPPALEEEYLAAFAAALSFARKTGAISRADDARERWRDAYEQELSIDRFGLAGAVCSRAEAHVLRVSMLYALLDQSSEIRLEHLEAALAIWRYCEQSALLIFGDRLGDPVADAIVDALEQAGQLGLTRQELRDHFSRHKTAAELDTALSLLLGAGLIAAEAEPTGGRPVTRYWLTEWAPEGPA